MEKKETNTEKDNASSTTTTNNKKLAATAQMAIGGPTTKATAKTTTMTRTSDVAVVEPSDSRLFAAPSIDNDDESNANSSTERLVSPGAFRVRGIGANNAHSDSLLADVSHQDDEDDSNSELPQQQQQEPFVMVDVVSEEDLRREYLPEAHNELLEEPVKAEPFQERTKHRHRVWIALAIIAVVTIILAAVLVPVLVVFLPANHHPGNNPKTGADTPPPQPQTMCSITTNFLIGNNTNLTALLLNQSAVSPTWESLDNGQTYGTHDASSDATQANKLCSKLGGKFVEEDFTVMCNSSAQNNNDNGTLVAQFKRNFVCVGKTCNTTEVESYLQAQIVSQTQSLEKEANRNCEAFYATYTYQDSSTQEQQVSYYLPSIWGEQCALEYDTITNKINNFTISHDTAAIPSCQRNGTTNDAFCTVDFIYDATQITGPFCNNIQGSRSLQLDFTFQCASKSGATYVIEHLHQSVCTGVSCDLSRVKHFTTDLFRSSLTHQGYRNCQLLSSGWYNASNHTIKQELNVSALVLDGNCQMATAFLSGNLSLAAFYSDANTAAIHPTNNFGSQSEVAANLCYEQEGNQFQFVEDDFTIVCDSLVQNGTSSVYYYDFLHVFHCLGVMCNASEVESYLEWPLVLYTHRLESGGHVQNCRVRYGSYMNLGDGQTDYLPSIWGDKCVAENKLISSNTNLTTLQSDTVIRPAYKKQGNQAIKVTTDHIGYNSQFETACLSIGGQYFEVDFTFTCGYQVGSNTTFDLEYLRYPQCTGMSCNVNQSSAESVETIKLLLTDTYGLQDCQLVLQDGPYQNASTLQQRNVSGDDGECTLATNIISTNSHWAAFNNQNFDDESCTKGNAKNCTIDQSPYASDGNSSCTSAGGQLVGFNYITLGDCNYYDSITTYNYINDLYCNAPSCNAEQIRNYRIGEIAKRYIENNCSEGLLIVT